MRPSEVARTWSSSAVLVINLPLLVPPTLPPPVMLLVLLGEEEEEGDESTMRELTPSSAAVAGTDEAVEAEEVCLLASATVFAMLAK